MGTIKFYDPHQVSIEGEDPSVVCEIKLIDLFNAAYKAMYAKATKDETPFPMTAEQRAVVEAGFIAAAQLTMRCASEWPGYSKVVSPECAATGDCDE
jgi:hypothetical protein